MLGKSYRIPPELTELFISLDIDMPLNEMRKWLRLEEPNLASHKCDTCHTYNKWVCDECLIQGFSGGVWVLSMCRVCQPHYYRPHKWWKAIYWKELLRNYKLRYEQSEKEQIEKEESENEQNEEGKIEKEIIYELKI